MRVEGKEGSTIPHKPNSHRQWAESNEHVEPKLALEGDAFHYDHREDDDYYNQPGNLFRMMSLSQQQINFENTARQTCGAEQFI